MLDSTDIQTDSTAFQQPTNKSIQIVSVQIFRIPPLQGFDKIDEIPGIESRIEQIEQQKPKMQKQRTERNDQEQRGTTSKLSIQP